MKLRMKILGILLSVLMITSMSFNFSVATQVKNDTNVKAEKETTDIQAGKEIKEAKEIKDTKSDDRKTQVTDDATRLIKKRNLRRAPLKSFKTEDGIRYGKIDGQDAFAVVGYEGDSEDMIIPSNVINPGDGKSYPVTRIRQDLTGYSKIVNLVIPEGVTQVDNSAFFGCKKLKTVKIGNGVKELDSAFANCSELTTVELPSSLEKLFGTFEGCSSLQQINLPDGLKEIGGFGKSGIKEITLPDSVTKVYKYAFSNCKDLEKINLNSNISELEKKVFFGCEKLKTINGGAHITSIGDQCFGGYEFDDNTNSWVWKSSEKLETLGDIDFSKVSYIGEYAFYNMPNLRYKDNKLHLDKLESLGMYAFFNAQGIENLEIGDRLEAIPESAFAYSYNIKTIKLSNSIKKIGNGAFTSGDAETIQIGSNDNSKLQEIGENAFSDESKGSVITIHTAKSDVKLKNNSFGALDNVKWTIKSENETGKVIYINGKDGDDTKDGLTKDNSVKTFDRAKEIAKKNKNIKTIYVTETVTIAGDVSLKDTNAILKRDESFTDTMITVEKGKEATLSNITIDGNSRKVDAISSIIYVENSILNIEKGTILQKNTVKVKGRQTAGGGAVHVSSNGIINMKGGLIKENDATWGGGVFVHSGWQGNATFNMSGGTIQNNRAMHDTRNQHRESGGGICTWSGGGDNIVNISGNAIIRNNKSAERGGGISIGTQGATNGNEFLNMTGGIVTGNEAGAAGGGIFVQANYKKNKNVVNIFGGSITNNKMTGGGTGNKSFGGGGIYVNGVGETQTAFANGELNLKNAIISDNTAKLEGGGYASCPVSKTRLYLKNSVAIYNNNGSAGRDMYILAGQWGGLHDGSPEYTITNTMLGGVPYLWKYENGREVPLSDLEGVLDGRNENSLKLHTDAVGNDNTKKFAKVFITGNSSITRGGGIGSNGTVNMGEKELTELDITKKWEYDNEGSRPDKIQIKLYRSIEGSQSESIYMGYDEISPDADGNWKLTFKNLPKYDDNGKAYIYTIKEVEVLGYSVNISGNQDEGYTITNSKNPEKTSIRVQKIWNDSNDKNKVRPNRVEINLLANGKYTGKTLVLSADNDWRGSFEDLDISQAGEKISYTITETNIHRYTSKITGNSDDGFIVTNTLEPIENVPKTGDITNINTVIVLLIITLSMIVYIQYRRKKNS